MSQASTIQRRHWMKWFEAHRRDGAATCQHFGISRATFYRWLRRYRANPGLPLKAKSRRPRTKRQKVLWTPLNTYFVATISGRHPTWGRARVHAELARLDLPPLSEALIGRMLRQIRRKCPLCGGAEGVHDLGAHFLRQDFLAVGIPPAWFIKRRTQSSGTPTTPTTSGGDVHAQNGQTAWRNFLAAWERS